MVGELVSYVRPAGTLKIEDIQGFRTRAKELLTQLIAKKGKNVANYTIRDILPKTDLGEANEEWKHSYAAAYTEETFINKTLDDDRFLVLYGYTNNGGLPKTLYLYMYRGAAPIKLIHVQHLYAQEEPTGYFEPEGWAEKETVTVKVYGNATGDDYPVLLGLFAEPKEEKVTG